jgi:hypothetical protein
MNERAGICNHDRQYGFRACAKRRIPDVQLHIGDDDRGSLTPH